MINHKKRFGPTKAGGLDVESSRVPSNAGYVTTGRSYCASISILNVLGDSSFALSRTGVFGVGHSKDPVSRRILGQQNVRAQGEAVC